MKALVAPLVDRGEDRDNSEDMSDRHRMPTTVGSELAVISDGGELMGYVGETQARKRGDYFYARSLDESPLQWFETKQAATAYLKGLA